MMSMRACEAGRDARLNVRAHDRPAAGEHQRQVVDVVPCEGGRRARLDDVLGDQQHGQPRPGRFVCRDIVRRDARALQRLPDRLAHVPVDVAFGTHRDRERRGADRVAGQQHAVEGGDEVAHLPIGNPQGVGEIEKSRVGDAAIEFGEEALLPRRRVIHDGDGFDAELQG